MIDAEYNQATVRSAGILFNRELAAFQRYFMRCPTLALVG
jgi:hypothetical protein